MGFLLRSVQRCPCCNAVSTGLNNTVVRYCKRCEGNVGYVCEHSGTSDGTVACHCGVTPENFINAAREFISDHSDAIEERNR